MQEQKINRREILKMLVTLSIPTILEEILSTLLQYVDTAMVGHLGEKATASVSVTTTVTWLVNSIPAALGVAVLSMTAKAFLYEDYSPPRTTDLLPASQPSPHCHTCPVRWLQ